MTTKTRSKTTAKKTRSRTTKSQSTKKSGENNEVSLHKLLEDNLKDMYSAEMQLVDALPEMAEAAHNTELEQAFTNHLEQTKTHFSRLEKILEKLDIDTEKIEKCAAMEGLIKENKKLIEEYEESHIRDSALIIGAQKIEHYEIAGYGSLCELADVLGYSNLHDLLGQTLNEEETTDEELTEVAVAINDEAKEMSDGETEYEDENLSKGGNFK